MNKGYVALLGFIVLLLSSHLCLSGIIEVSQGREKLLDGGVSEEERQILNELDSVLLKLIEQYIIYILISLSLIIIGIGYFFEEIERLKNLRKEFQKKPKQPTGREMISLEEEKRFSRLEKWTQEKGIKAPQKPLLSKEQKKTLKKAVLIGYVIFAIILIAYFIIQILNL